MGLNLTLTPRKLEFRIYKFRKMLVGKLHYKSIELINQNQSGYNETILSCFA